MSQSTARLELFVELQPVILIAVGIAITIGIALLLWANWNYYKARLVSIISTVLIVVIIILVSAIIINNLNLETEKEASRQCVEMGGHLHTYKHIKNCPPERNCHDHGYFCQMPNGTEINHANRDMQTWKKEAGKIDKKS